MSTYVITELLKYLIFHHKFFSLRIKNCWCTVIRRCGTGIAFPWSYFHLRFTSSMKSWRWRWFIIFVLYERSLAVHRCRWSFIGIWRKFLGRWWFWWWGSLGSNLYLKRELDATFVLFVVYIHSKNTFHAISKNDMVNL